MKNTLIVFTFILVFAVRLLWIQYNPVLDVDSYEYLRLAGNLLNYQTFSLSDTLPVIPYNWRVPIYPLFIAGLWKIFGSSQDIIYYAQAVLSTLTIFIIFSVAKELFNFETAILSTLLNCFFLPALVLQGAILSETLYAFLLISALSLCIIPRIPNLIFCSMAGICFGCAVLTRPEGLFFPFIFGLILLYPRRARKKEFSKILTILSIFLVIIAFWVYRNYKQVGNPSLVHSVFFYRGLSGGLGLPHSDPLVRGYFAFKYESNPDKLQEYKQKVLSFYWNYIKENPISYLRVRSKQILKLWVYGGSYERWDQTNASYKTLYLEKKWALFWGRMGVYLIFGMIPLFITLWALFKGDNDYKNKAILFSYPIYVTFVFLPAETCHRYGLPAQMLLSIFMASTLVKHIGPYLKGRRQGCHKKEWDAQESD